MFCSKDRYYRTDYSYFRICSVVSIFITAILHVLTLTSCFVLWLCYVFTYRIPFLALASLLDLWSGSSSRKYLSPSKLISPRRTQGKVNRTDLYETGSRGRLVRRLAPVPSVLAHFHFSSLSGLPSREGARVQWGRRKSYTRFSTFAHGKMRGKSLQVRRMVGKTSRMER